MELINISKKYINENNLIEAIKNVTVSFEKRKLYAIMGASGSGKSTLINIIGLLDDYSEGKYYLENKEVSKLTADEKSELRSLKIGFVFQSYYLNPSLSAIENVMLPTFINKNIKKEDRRKKAEELLNQFNLKDRHNHYPSQLSGGEQQRVAIARALINDPDIIIADEPTGNLDSVNEKEVFKILKDISLSGKTVIIVTHNILIKDYSDILLTLNNGILEVNSL